ncbi:MAG: hypothetical protein KDH96_02470 [Candidatus Riesia sp.]|nr:hypothetical protein [Candidatus Riesia sp.]
MNKPKKGVKYVDDIIKEVALESGRNEKEVREAWKIHIEYIKDLMDRDDVYIIELPKLGNLFYNTFTQKNIDSKTFVNKDNKLNEKSAKLRDMIKADFGKVNTKYTYPQIKRANLYNLYKSIQSFVHKIKKSYSSFKNVIRTIEEYSIKNYKDE